MAIKRLWALDAASLSLSLMLLLSAAVAGDVEESDTVRLPDIRDELFMRVAKDQAARKAGISWAADHGVNGIIDESLLTDEEKAVHARLQAEVARIDAENTAWLKKVVDEEGWLTYSDVGLDGTDAAWLLVQHADADPTFQRRCLDLMTSIPRNEVSQQNLAYLTDRVLLKEGKNQIYGTQFVIRDGEWVPLNLEDKENVDARRAEAGLPPLDEYKAMLEAVMSGEVEIE
jgi:hypothetical protein